eukprot:s1753_g2.t1
MSGLICTMAVLLSEQDQGPLEVSMELPLLFPEVCPPFWLRNETEDRLKNVQKQWFLMQRQVEKGEEYVKIPLRLDHRELCHQGQGQGPETIVVHNSRDLFRYAATCTDRCEQLQCRRPLRHLSSLLMMFPSRDPERWISAAESVRDWLQADGDWSFFDEGSAEHGSQRGEEDGEKKTRDDDESIDPQDRRPPPGSSSSERGDGGKTQHILSQLRTGKANCCVCVCACVTLLLAQAFEILPFPKRPLVCQKANMGEERQDPSGGLMYNQFSRVRVEITWKDRIRKENEARLAGPKSGFQMNLAQLSASGGFLHLKHAHNRLETVVEKEIKQSPQQRMSAEGMDPNSMEVLAIKHTNRKPQEKFDTPMTTTQELGWLIESPVHSQTMLPPPAEMRRSGSLPGLSEPTGGSDGISSARKLNLTENLLASGVAVVGATVFTHPIDVVKVQLQMAEKSCAKADSFSLPRFVSFWQKFQRRAGTGALFSGLQAASMRAATYGTVRIGLCEPLQEVAGRSGGAVIAGVLATVVGNPFEVLKVRLQAEPQLAATGELQLLRRMVQSEGLAGKCGLPVLASGFGWAATRSSLLTVSQVVPYAHAKNALKRCFGIPEGGALHVTASLMAGLVTTTVTAPVDVLKTKALRWKGRGWSPSEAMSAGQSDIAAMLKLGHHVDMRIMRVGRAHGLFAFFKGWLANYVRLGPQTTFIFVFYEQARKESVRLAICHNNVCFPQGPLPGSLYCTLRARTQPYSQLSVTTPANDLVLKRTLSAPAMPKEEPLPELKKLNSTRWRRPKSSSDVTRYAEAFYNLNGCSPFALAAGK